MDNILNLEAMKNLNSYNAEMAKSSYDKLGFVDRIFDNIDTVVDFGCADGSVTELLRFYYPKAKIIGYDIAEIQNPSTTSTVIYTNDLDIVKNELTGTSLLVMNSVMHEIFHYMSKEDADALINRLIDMNFTYIWIRDMYISSKSTFMDKSFLQLNLDRLNEFLDKDEKFMSKKLAFETIYGQINDWSNMIHFLLKCRFDANWHREVKEDYTAFGRNKDELFKKLSNKYDETYDSLYVLPYIEYINQKDFAISIKSLGMTTHLKSIWRLK